MKYKKKKLTYFSHKTNFNTYHNTDGDRHSINLFDNQTFCDYSTKINLSKFKILN